MRNYKRALCIAWSLQIILREDPIRVLLLSALWLVGDEGDLAVILFTIPRNRMSCNPRVSWFLSTSIIFCLFLYIYSANSEKLIEIWISNNLRITGWTTRSSALYFVWPGFAQLPRIVKQWTKSKLHSAIDNNPKLTPCVEIENSWF
jgi:hypothetical protein